MKGILSSCTLRLLKMKASQKMPVDFCWSKRLVITAQCCYAEHSSKETKDPKHPYWMSCKDGFKIRKVYAYVWCELCATHANNYPYDAANCCKCRLLTCTTQCSMRNRSCWMISWCPEIKKIFRCQVLFQHFDRFCRTCAATMIPHDCRPSPYQATSVNPVVGQCQWKAEAEGLFCIHINAIRTPWNTSFTKNMPKDPIEAASCCICSSCKVFVTIIKLEFATSWPLGEGMGKEM